MIHVNGEEIPVHVAKYVHKLTGEEGVEVNTSLVFMHEALGSLVQIFGVTQYTPLAKQPFNPRETQIYRSNHRASNADVEDGLNALIFMSEKLPFSSA